MPIHARSAETWRGDETLPHVSNDLEIIGERDRAVLLEQGIKVFAARVDEAGTTHVFVTGGDEAWVRPAVLAQLGPGIDVTVCGTLPRELRPTQCVGYMEREAGRLQLRYVVRTGIEHMDDIEVTEDDRTVIVFARMCTPVTEEAGDELECPYHVYLDSPLGVRTVIDRFDGQPVPYKDVYVELRARYGLR